MLNPYQLTEANDYNFVQWQMVHTKEQRSYNMSRIKGKDTKPKWWCVDFYMQMDSLINSTIKSLPGKPDIVLPKYKTVIFVHGCFEI